MTRALRGAWSRRGVLGTLVAMTGVVVAGAVTVIGFAEAAGTSRLLAAPLLLLGLVAVPAIGRELATGRREEIGLARLRGIHGRRLVAVLLGEPAVAIVLGASLGLLAGWVLVPLATRVWLDVDGNDGAAPSVWTAAVLLTAGGTAVAGLVAVLAGSWGALREPLANQVSMTTRPRRATTATIFLSLLAIVGAGVAVYRSRAGGGDADLLVLLGPALVGLALGQVAVWTLRGVARAVLGRTGRGGLAAFLASRRVARADDLTGPVRLVVAAGVVAALAASGATSVTGWSDLQARVDLAGPRVVPLEDTGAVGALALTHELDPEGTSLMAAVLLPGNDQLTERRAYVDTSRWTAVSGDTLSGTGAAVTSTDLDALAPEVPEWDVPADRFTVAAELGPDTPPGNYLVGVDYVADGDVLSSAAVRLRIPRSGRGRASVPLPDCTRGCQVRALTAVPEAGAAGPGAPQGVSDVRELRVTEARFGDVDLLSARWRPGETVPDRWVPRRPEKVDEDAELVVNDPDGLTVLLVPYAETRVDLRTSAVPVLATRGGDPTTAYGTPGGDDRTAEVVATREVLPLVGRVGTVADLVAGAWASSPAGASAQTFVVVAEDASPAVVSALEEEAGAEPESLAEARSAIEGASGGSQSGAYLLMAAACLVVTLLALVAGAARLRRAHARDVAGLRSVGVPVRTARAAGRGELAAVAVLVAAVVVLGGWLAVELLLPGLPLLDLPPGGVPFRPDPELLPLLLPALLAGLAVVLLGGRARRVTAGSTRPALLREEGA